jgi:hypothetical protein
MVSPLSIIAVMAVLSATTRRPFKAVFFTITYATVFSAICLVLVAIGSAATIGVKPSPATAGFDVVLGIILLYVAGRSLTKGVNTPLLRSFDPDAMSIAAVVSMGVLFSASNFSSLIPALAASKDIGVAAVPPFGKMVALVFLLAIALSWVWAPVAVYLVTPNNFDRFLDPVITFLRRHGGQLMAAVLFVIGLYLLVRGMAAYITL